MSKKSGSALFQFSTPKSFSPELFEQTLQAYLQENNIAAALELFDNLPRNFKHQPEFMLMRATVLIAMEETQEAFILLREIERKYPRFEELYLPLAMFYMDMGYPVHAMEAANHLIHKHDLPQEPHNTIHSIVADTSAKIKSLADEFNLTFEKMQQACRFHEQAQMRLDFDELAEVISLCNASINIAPKWNPPHNDLANALYFLGKTSEAIAQAEDVLSRDPNNILALRSLTIFTYGLNQVEKAQGYATRLRELTKNLSLDNIDIEHAIMALALVEDTPVLWEIANRFLKAPSNFLISRSWHCLAVAAIRSGNLKSGQKFLKKIPKEDLFQDKETLLQQIEKALASEQTVVAWNPPVYPGADIYFHPKVLAEWDALLENFSSNLSPAQLSQLTEFFKKYPFMKTAMKRLLWQEESHASILAVFEQLADPDTDAEVMRFGLSQTGSQQARMGAVLTLLRTGRYTGVKNVKLWDEEKREWVEKELFSRRVGYVPPNVQPKTLEVINKARTAKNPKEAIKLMRKAIDMEPTCAMAYYNLGVLLSQNGNLVEGETLIFKSVEVDPTYMFGHASIALNEAQADHEIKALEHLKIIEKAEIIDSETAFLENLAWLLLAVNKGDLVAASQRLDMASRINPDHTLLKIYKDLLDSADNEEENIDTFFDDYHIKSSRIIHKKLLKTSLTSQTELAACLEVYSKESLTAIARFVHIRLVGKKTEMLSKLVPCFLNQAFLEQILKSDLHPDEREALKWVLQNNGARLWNDFVEKFSDDYVESPHWLYHEPQSIMGRLRNSGLLHLGTLDDQQVVFIPADLRPFLQSIFKNMQD